MESLILNAGRPSRRQAENPSPNPPGPAKRSMTGIGIGSSALVKVATCKGKTSGDFANPCVTVRTSLWEFSRLMQQRAQPGHECSSDGDPRYHGVDPKVSRRMCGPRPFGEQRTSFCQLVLRVRQGSGCQ